MRFLIGSCEETFAAMSEHLERDLPLRRSLRVSLHLKFCKACASVYASLERTVARLRELGPPPASPSIVEAVVERVREEPR